MRRHFWRRLGHQCLRSDDMTASGIYLAPEQGQVEVTALVLVCKDSVRAGHQLEQLV